MRMGLATCVSTLLLCGYAVGQWSGPGGGGDRTGASDANLNAPLTLAWRHVTDDCTWTATSPAATEDVVVFAVGENVYGIDPVTGAELWSYEAKGVVNSQPTVDGDLVFIGDHVGAVHCLDVASGRRVFEYRVEDDNDDGVDVAVQSGFAVVNDLVYFGDDTGMLHRLRARAGNGPDAGSPVGQLNLGTQIVAAPTYYRGVLYVATVRSVIAVQGLDGQLRRGAEIPLGRGGAYVLGSPVVADDRVLVAVGNDVVALTSDGLTPVWRAEARGKVYGSPAVADGKVVFADIQGVVTCVSLANGEELWHAPLGEVVRAVPDLEYDKQEVRCSLVVASGLAYARTAAGTLVAFDLNTGDIVWRYKTEARKDPTKTTAGAAGGGRGGAGGAMGGSMGGSMGGPMGMGGGGPMGMGGMGGAQGAQGAKENGGKGATNYTLAEDVSSGLAIFNDTLYVLGGTGTLYALRNGSADGGAPIVSEATVFVPDQDGKHSGAGWPIAVYDAAGEPDREISPYQQFNPTGAIPDPGPVAFQMKIRDLGSGLDPDSIDATLEGPSTHLEVFYYESEETIQVYIPRRDGNRALEEGDYVLRIAASDHTGRASVHEIRFTVDPDLESPTGANAMGGFRGGGPAGSGGMMGEM